MRPVLINFHLVAIYQKGSIHWMRVHTQNTVCFRCTKNNLATTSVSASLLDSSNSFHVIFSHCLVMLAFYIYLEPKRDRNMLNAIWTPLMKTRRCLVEMNLKLTA